MVENYLQGVDEESIVSNGSSNWRVSFFIRKRKKQCKKVLFRSINVVIVDLNQVTDAPQVETETPTFDTSFDFKLNYCIGERPYFSTSAAGRHNC